MEIIRSRVSEDANIIFGTCYDQSMEGSVHVSIIVSGIETDVISPPVRTAALLSSQAVGSETTDASASEATDATSSSSRGGGLFSRFFSL